jgi:hypothetical protein
MLDSTDTLTCLKQNLHMPSPLAGTWPPINGRISIARMSKYFNSFVSLLCVTHMLFAVCVRACERASERARVTHLLQCVCGCVDAGVEVNEGKARQLNQDKAIKRLAQSRQGKVGRETTKDKIRYERKREARG